MSAKARPWTKKPEQRRPTRAEAVGQAASQQRGKGRRHDRRQERKPGLQGTEAERTLEIKRTEHNDRDLAEVARGDHQIAGVERAAAEQRHLDQGRRNPLLERDEAEQDRAAADQQR